MVLVKKLESANGNNFTTFVTPAGETHRGAVLIDGNGDAIFPTLLAPTTDMEGAGRLAISTTPVELTFATLPLSIVISAANDNIGTLYIGKSDILFDGSNAITYLDAGEKMVLTHDITDNPIFIVADLVDQNYFKGGLF